MKVQNYYMKEIKLNEADYSAIKEITLRNYIDLNIRSNSNHITILYIEAILAYTISKNLIIKEGKFFKND